MNLGRYLKKLLLENDTVIVPGLGAFGSTYKAAKIDENSGVILPPSKEIFFDPKILNNDGLLEEYITRVEQIMLSEARRKIETGRDEILYRLDKEESVKLGSLGTLFVDENGEIAFNPSGENNLLRESFGLEATSYNEETYGVNEKQEPAEPLSAIVNKEAGEIRDKEREKNAGFSPPNDNFVNYHGRRRRTGWLWVLLILVLLIVACIYLLIPGKKEPATPIVTTIAPPVKEPDTILLTDTVKTDSLITTEDDIPSLITDTLIPAGQIIPDPSAFYLIGGSYKKIENAETYFQQMKKKGFNPFHLGKQGSYYIVGLEVFDNEIAAYGAQYNFLDKYPDSGVWIFSPEN